MAGLFQVEDASHPGFYLGSAGWSQHRPSALVFTNDRAAMEWIDGVKTTASRLMMDRQPTIVPAPEPPEEAFANTIASDFDPYRHEVA